MRQNQSHHAVSRCATPTKCTDCAIRHLALFHGVPEDQLDWTQGFRSAQLEYRAKHTLVDEGTRPESLYTLYSGWAVVFKTLFNGKRQIIRIALPGDLLGYQSNLAGPSDVSIQAITPLVVCAFPRGQFCEYLRGRPDLTKSLNRMSAYYMSMCQQYLMGIGRKSARERVAFLILDLWYRGRDLGEIIGFSDESGMDFPISQEDMGDALGVSAVHVNRTLRELRDEGKIQLEHRRLCVLDEASLCEEARFDPETVLSRYSILS